MVKVKNCPRITLPTPDASLPPPPPLIPTSIVTVKSVPSAPPPIPISALVKKLAPPPSAPPSKKPCPQPFIRGQVGRKFFSLSQLHTYTKIPDGCSLIIAGFRKPLPHETVKK